MIFKLIKYKILNPTHRRRSKTGDLSKGEISLERPIHRSGSGMKDDGCSKQSGISGEQGEGREHWNIPDS